MERFFVAKGKMLCLYGRLFQEGQEVPVAFLGRLPSEEIERLLSSETLLVEVEAVKEDEQEKGEKIGFQTEPAPEPEPAPEEGDE